MKPLAQNTLIQNRYLIVQLIGKGGMGEVYLAVDQRLGSAVALKRTFFADDEMLGNAFEREARVLARLRHPVLPKVSDHFGEGEEQFLVMEHISGDDLSSRIEALQKPFPLSWVMFWADQLLDALSYLHSHEPPIIHRDIKPQNLKLTDENHIILLDFGLSKSSTGMTNLSGGSTGSTGSVVGYTPHYAPMEQIRGIGTSAKSDLYSLAATLYQLLTNTVPVDALTRADSMLNGQPDPIKSPSDINPEVPPAVSEVILKAMEVSQERRYQTAREMQKALRKAFSEMQQAMSAATMVISADEMKASGVNVADVPNFDATEVMDPEAIRAISHPSATIEERSSPQHMSIGQPAESPVADMDATIAYDPGAMSDPIRQADVKTEVFIPNSFSVPTSETDARVNSQTSEPEPTALEDFSPTTNYATSDWQSREGGAGVEGFSPDATTPFIAYQGNGGESGGGYQETFSSDSTTGQPAAFDTSAGMADDQSRSEASSSGPVVAVAAPSKAKRSGSTGKILLILGGLFVFFVAVLGLAGGGWYYYTNYYAGGVVEPTPSPEPTIEAPTPSPEPTQTDVFGSDNTNSDSNSLGNNMVEPTPTPEPTSTPVGDNQRPVQRPTPVQTRPSPRPLPSKTETKPQPTKKPGGKVPDILQ